MDQWLSPECTTHPSFKLRTLYTWEAGRSEMLSRLILHLKGPRASAPWQVYAQQFVRRLNIESGWRLCIVPAPPRKILHRDHAYYWGEALAQNLGASFLPCLEKISSGSQRQARGDERALIEMRSHEKSTKEDSILWVFADDVFTTGATAAAAYAALGRPPHFEVWTLVQRRLACRPSEDLLYRSDE
ncbi:MAG: hypothetical protein AAGB31_02370 [Bdellovibrio sp.]